jgi:hypothetical protein
VVLTGLHPLGLALKLWVPRDGNGQLDVDEEGDSCVSQWLVFVLVHL